VTAAAAEPAGAGARQQRLLPAPGPESLAAHLARNGPLPPDAAGRLIDAVEQAGLTGRGGGAFPAGAKMRAVTQAARRGGAVVVGNGCESEPASGKDSVLLANAPHLVLDGIELAAAAVGATSAYLCAPAGLWPLGAALAERHHAGLSQLEVQLLQAPAGYVSGQETAVISALNGGAPVPTFVPPRPAERGVRRRPTLVLNVETLAHVALIARHGPAWFRQAGTPQAPGTALVTISGEVRRPGIYEIPLGTTVSELLHNAGPAGPAQAILTGGYFGSWLPLPDAGPVRISPDGLRAAGGSLGPGIFAVLPEDRCGLAETARVLGYLASQTARQCGPCTNGTPALARAMHEVAFGRPDGRVIGWVQELGALITGRGACHLPDGAAALAASALRVFAADLHAHSDRGPCGRAERPPVLPLPPAGPGQPSPEPVGAPLAGAGPGSAPLLAGRPAVIVTDGFPGNVALRPRGARP
jgi:NADH:ubiquinone oxidoreductase subunit F (NADH-binding)